MDFFTTIIVIYIIFYVLPMLFSSSDDEIKKNKEQNDESEKIKEATRYKQHPTIINKHYKNNWENFDVILKENQVTKLYHFTDRENLASIRESGGLYSRQMCIDKNIHIPKPGGNNFSFDLDKRKGLENYIRLSFVKDLPMLHIAKQEGRIINEVILEIDTSVIFYKATMFSDVNATANDANIGPYLTSFKKIDFDVLNQKTWYNEDDKHHWQAEVLVKDFIPIKLIKNL